jgi:hypothetical protein
VLVGLVIKERAASRRIRRSREERGIGIEGCLSLEWDDSNCRRGIITMKLDIP